jgi:hypothetical protein
MIDVRMSRRVKEITRGAWHVFPERSVYLKIIFLVQVGCVNFCTTNMLCKSFHFGQYGRIGVQKNSSGVEHLKVLEHTHTDQL